MRYQRIFELQIRHGYYVDGRCTDLAIEPSTSEDGERALARHRLLAKPRAGGLEVVGPVDGEGKPFIALEGLRLRFDLRIASSNFVRATDLATWTKLVAPRYRNKSGVTGKLELAEKAASPHPPGIAAAVQISNISSSWLAKPPSFTLELSPLSTLWVYYLTTTRSNGAAPQISDSDPERPLAFESTLLSPNDALASSDPIGHGLLRRYPDRRCFRLISGQLLACQQAPRRKLALYLGDELLIRELANPAIQDFTILTLEPNKPRDSLFRVVEF